MQLIDTIAQVPEDDATRPDVARILILVESLIDCDIVVSDTRAALTAAIRQRDAVARQLAEATHV